MEMLQVIFEPKELRGLTNVVSKYKKTCANLQYKDIKEIPAETKRIVDLTKKIRKFYLIALSRSVGLTEERFYEEIMPGSMKGFKKLKKKLIPNLHNGPSKKAFL